jgi:hypothetical protein
MTVLAQARLVSYLLIIQHLSNQYNQFEYNRVLLSRECYAQSMRILFDYGQPGSGYRFVDTINSILSKVVKVPSSKSWGSQSSVQALCTLVIERTMKIFTTVSLFLEEQKKRDKQRKLEAKRRKELKAKQQETAKKGEDSRVRADQDLLPKELGVVNEEPQIESLAEQAEQQNRVADALMNAESSSDNDIHGEGAQSQQQDLQMAQEVGVDEPEVNNEMEHYEDEPGDYDEEQQDEEDPEVEDDEEQYEMDEQEEQMILQQPAPMNVHLVGEEEAEGEEMMGEYAMEDDNEDLDEDDLLSEEEMDDMPSDEEDQMMMPVGMGGHHHRGRHGRNERVLQRDILFDAGDAPPGRAAFVLGDGLRLEREQAVADLGRAPGGHARGSRDFGPNWSQEEEEVARILRNLRGLGQNGGAAGPEPNPHPPGQVAAQPLNHRYAIELEVASQFKDSRQQLAQAKKSIE